MARRTMTEITLLALSSFFLRVLHHTGLHKVRHRMLSTTTHHLNCKFDIHHVLTSSEAAHIDSKRTEQGTAVPKVSQPGLLKIWNVKRHGVKDWHPTCNRCRGHRTLPKRLKVNSEIRHTGCYWPMNSTTHLARFNFVRILLLGRHMALKTPSKPVQKLQLSAPCI